MSDFEMEKFREEHESEEHWSLRKAFLSRWKNNFDEDRLLCLARVFTNIELMGCRYPSEVMTEIAGLSEEVVKSYRDKRKNKLKRTFVSASDAAEDRARGVKRQGGVILDSSPAKNARIAFVPQGHKAADDSRVTGNLTSPWHIDPQRNQAYSKLKTSSNGNQGLDIVDDDSKGSESAQPLPSTTLPPTKKKRRSGAQRRKVNRLKAEGIVNKVAQSSVLDQTCENHSCDNQNSIEKTESRLNQANCEPRESFSSTRSHGNVTAARNSESKSESPQPSTTLLSTKKNKRLSGAKKRKILRLMAEGVAHEVARASVLGQTCQSFDNQNSSEKPRSKPNQSYCKEVKPAWKNKFMSGSEKRRIKKLVAAGFTPKVARACDLMRAMSSNKSTEVVSVRMDIPQHSTTVNNTDSGSQYYSTKACESSVKPELRANKEDIDPYGITIGQGYVSKGEETSGSESDDCIFVPEVSAPTFVPNTFASEASIPIVVPKASVPIFVPEAPPAPIFVPNMSAPIFSSEASVPTFVPKASVPIFMPQAWAPIFVPKTSVPIFVPKASAPTFVSEVPAPIFVPKAFAPIFVPKASAPIFVPKASVPIFVPKASAPIFVPKASAPIFEPKASAPAYHTEAIRTSAEGFTANQNSESKNKQNQEYSSKKPPKKRNRLSKGHKRKVAELVANGLAYDVAVARVRCPNSVASREIVTVGDDLEDSESDYCIFDPEVTASAIQSEAKRTSAQSFSVGSDHNFGNNNIEENLFQGNRKRLKCPVEGSDLDEPIRTQLMEDSSKGHGSILGSQSSETLPPIKKKRLSGAQKRRLNKLIAEGLTYEAALIRVLERKNSQGVISDDEEEETTTANEPTTTESISKSNQLTSGVQDYNDYLKVCGKHTYISSRQNQESSSQAIGGARGTVPAQIQTRPTYSGRFSLTVNKSFDAEECLLQGVSDSLRDPASVGDIDLAEPKDQPIEKFCAGHRPVEGVQPPTTLPPAEKQKSKKLSGAAKRNISKLMAMGVAFEEARALVVGRKDFFAGQNPESSEASGLGESDSGKRLVNRDCSEEDSSKLQPRKRENANTIAVRAIEGQGECLVGAGQSTSRVSTEKPAGEGPHLAASPSVCREPQPSTSSHAVTSFRDTATVSRLGVFHKVPMAQDQLDLTKVAILNAIWDGEDGHQVRFLGSAAKPEGWLQITCADMPSRDWSLSRIPALVPFPGAVLSVRTNLPKRKTGVVVVSSEEAKDPRQVFAGLECQNHGLDTSRWNIVRVEENTDKTFSIVFYLDDGSVEQLRTLNFRPYFGFRRINVRVKGVESASRKRTAAISTGEAIAGPSGTSSGGTGSSSMVRIPEAVVPKASGGSQPTSKTLTVQRELAKRAKPRKRGKPKPRKTGGSTPINPPRRPPQN